MPLLIVLVVGIGLLALGGGLVFLAVDYTLTGPLLAYLSMAVFALSLGLAVIKRKRTTVA